MQKGDHAHARLARALRARVTRAGRKNNVTRPRKYRARARCARETQTFNTRTRVLRAKTNFEHFFKVSVQFDKHIQLILLKGNTP